MKHSSPLKIITMTHPANHTIN